MRAREGGRAGSGESQEQWGGAPPGCPPRSGPVCLVGPCELFMGLLLGNELAAGKRESEPASKLPVRSAWLCQEWAPLCAGLRILPARYPVPWSPRTTQVSFPNLALFFAFYFLPQPLSVCPPLSSELIFLFFLYHYYKT